MKTIKRLSLAAIGVAGLALPITYVSRQAPTIHAGTTVCGVAVGGLTVEDAQKKLRVWWETQKLTPVVMTAKIPLKTGSWTPGQLGVTFDDAATVASLPVNSFVDQASQMAGQASESKDFAPKFKVVGPAVLAVKNEIDSQLPTAKPATVKYDKGQILITKETPAYTVDVSRLGEQVAQALPASLAAKVPASIELPVTQMPKAVPDEALARIREVVSSYTTSFQTSNKPRTINLSIAAKCFPGVIVMPGKSISYNQIVGERTAARGYKEAGVFVNGRLDSGLGGGICQVSSTLYNAALLANLKIVERQNHSIPVVYVPLGRDSTVSYGSIDLRIRNTGSLPVAIASELHPGRLTFRILGTKTPGQVVIIEKSVPQTKPIAVETKVDPKLPPGARRVVEKGSPRKTVVTYRIVKVNGVLVKRERLGTSTYGGLPTVVAVGAGASESAVTLRGQG